MVMYHHRDPSFYGPPASRWHEVWWLDVMARMRDKQEVTLAEAMPVAFEACAKVFHPIWEDPADTQGLSWDEMDRHDPDPSTPMAFQGVGTVTRTADTDDVAGLPGWRQVPWAEVMGGRPLVPRLDWRGLAKVLGPSWPARLHGPAEGIVELPLLRRLVDHVRPWTHDRVLMLSGMLGHPPPRLGLEWWVSVTDDLDDLFVYKRLTGGPTPEMWFPEDQSWFVGTADDCCTTLVAGPRRLVEAVQVDPELETVAVAPDDVLYPIR